MKDIKWNRGLFRIWIVLSTLWIIAWIFDVLPYYENWESSILYSLIAPLIVLIAPLIVLIVFLVVQKIIKFIITGFKK